MPHDEAVIWRRRGDPLQEEVREFLLGDSQQLDPRSDLSERGVERLMVEVDGTVRVPR